MRGASSKRPEVRAKISAALKGRAKPTRSVAHCKALSRGHKGKRTSAETRRKMSEAHKARYQKDPTLAKRCGEALKLSLAGKTRKHSSVPLLGRRFPERGGPKHHNWKGGITAENTKDRRRFQKSYQPKVFLRDSYTCQVCEVTGGYLQVDHIKPWAEFPELRFDLNNCRTLCMACHYYITFKRKLPKGVSWGHGLSRRIAS